MQKARAARATESGREPMMSLETITPDVAERWLGKNLHNRNLSEVSVRRMAGAMTRGEWRLNGETIKFDDDGHLIDGQHRLKAVVESGVTITSFVLRGLEASSQETVDIGRKRTLADMLRLRGVASAHHVASSVNFLYLYDHDKVKRQGFEQWPTVQQGIMLYEANKEIENCANLGRRLAKLLNLSPSVASALYYIFSRIDQGDADYFFEKLEHGTEMF